MIQKRSKSPSLAFRYRAWSVNKNDTAEGHCSSNSSYLTFVNSTE